MLFVARCRAMLLIFYLLACFKSISYLLIVFVKFQQGGSADCEARRANAFSLKGVLV